MEKQMPHDCRETASWKQLIHRDGEQEAVCQGPGLWSSGRGSDGQEGKKVAEVCSARMCTRGMFPSSTRRGGWRGELRTLSPQSEADVRAWLLRKIQARGAGSLSQAWALRSRALGTGRAWCTGEP